MYTGSYRFQQDESSSFNGMIEEHVKESFVARIWLEQRDHGDASWRGHIRHVQGGEEGYFQNLLEMRDFLGRVSGVPGLPMTAQQLRDVTDSKPGTVTNMKRKDELED
jgi:hypothetical protein